ncbi:hypothetical cytosolic protein [Syntrophus aciditrophicus SB]|uniref:Hypothetical cytosolic protein n=1 Tax=Syntrophus aciditrophicus (strain SB) TaxID=56780 RepID=Q2LRG7_SYNAS|nr:hypothetical cytosolic protein [Syntrophus aciditrophicus SB]
MSFCHHHPNSSISSDRAIISRTISFGSMPCFLQSARFSIRPFSSSNFKMISSSSSFIFIPPSGHVLYLNQNIGLTLSVKRLIREIELFVCPFKNGVQDNIYYLNSSDNRTDY